MLAAHIEETYNKQCLARYFEQDGQLVSYFYPMRSLRK